MRWWTVGIAAISALTSYGCWWTATCWPCETGKQLEPFEIYRLEDEVNRFLYDPSNFKEPELERETERTRGY
jgi:hypothetical protein